MRNLHIKEFYKLATFMAIVLIFSSSCKKDDPVIPIVVPVTPNYVGTWIAIAPFTTVYGDIQMKDIKTFTDSSFTDRVQLEIATDLWINYGSMKSSLSVSGNLMNVTITDIGTSSTNMLGIPTGVITSYKKGSAEFNDLISLSGQHNTFSSEYNVSENQLTLKTDINLDGDYLDANETTVYTKQ